MKNKDKNTRINSKYTAMSIAVFVFLFAITQFLAYQNHLLLKSKINNYLHTEIDKLDSSISNILMSAEAALTTLSYVVQTYPNQEQFESITEVLLKSNPYLDALELVNAEGVIYAVNPLKGNESILGYNILKDTTRNKEVLKAIQKKEVFYAGPFALKQGGTAIVGRLPMFSENGDFIGLTAVLININTLISIVATDESRSKDVYFQFSKINPDTNIEEFFFPNPEVLQKDVSVHQYIESGDWTIYAQYVTESSFFSNLSFPILGFILSLIGSYLVSIVLKQPQKLELMVEEKTTELFNHQKKYRDLLEHSSDAVLVINDQFTISFVSNSFENMFGYNENESLKQAFFFFIHAEDQEFVKITLEQTKKLPYDELTQISFRIQSNDKKILWVEATFSNLSQKNGINGIVVNMHNITERVHYLEQLQKHNKQLKEIAWTQSHIVRAPLVRIMSLVHLINEVDYDEGKQTELLNHIYNSAIELDKIIIDITKKAEHLDFNNSKNSF